MSLTLAQTYTAIAVGLTGSFQGYGGTEPYVYSVVPGGAGGTIDPDSGIYTAPDVPNPDPNPNFLFDTIQVTDDVAATATAQILVGTPLLLVCEIIQKYMGLDAQHCFLWDQKLFIPNDYGLYVVISVESCKPFSNIIRYDGSGSGQVGTQTVNMYALLGMDIISRGPAARDQKELVIAALNSQYSQQQQEKNSFYIGKISTSFVNLTNIDGSAIPYRFRINVAIQYAITNNLSSQYFDGFATPTVYTNP